MRLYQRIENLAQVSLGLLFPARCVGCHDYLRRDELTCGRCVHTLFPIESPLCLVCGHPRTTVGAGYTGVDEICGRCLDRRPRFDTARARWEYAGVIAEALQRAKYAGQLWMLRSLAREFRPWLEARVDQACADDEVVVTTVPMHPKDLRRRGFDAGYLLARRALPGRRIHATLLRKIRRTPPQATLSRQERVSNLRGAFECVNPSAVRSKRIILIDDVLTTGATAHAIAKVLRRAGARDVLVFTAARAVANAHSASA